MVLKNIQVDEQSLIEAAKKARVNAYAPYSSYKVGAAVLDDNGQVHCVSKCENAAFRLGTCAEANAICAMVAAGGKRIVAIAAVGGDGDMETCTPCGGCRQSIREFSDENTRIIFVGNEHKIVSYSIEELLPVSFSLDSASGSD